MSESLTAKEKKQSGQNPPLNRRRIAGEIIVGIAVGFAAGLLGGFGFLLMPYDSGCFSGVLALATATGVVFPALYSTFSAVGVYLVGRRGKQTGSFLLTLGCGFAGWLIITGVYRLVHSFHWSNWLPFWAFVPLLLLIPPLLATLGFNLTRRYRNEPKGDVDRETDNQKE